MPDSSRGAVGSSSVSTEARSAVLAPLHGGTPPPPTPTTAPPQRKLLGCTIRRIPNLRALAGRGRLLLLLAACTFLFGALHTARDWTRDAARGEHALRFCLRSVDPSTACCASKATEAGEGPLSAVDQVRRRLHEECVRLLRVASFSRRALQWLRRQTDAGHNAGEGGATDAGPATAFQESSCSCLNCTREQAWGSLVGGVCLCVCFGVLDASAS